MNNCLVTKLKSVVDNDSLVKLGELPFVVRTETITNVDEQQRVNIGTRSEVEITVTGGGYFAKSEAELVTNPLTHYTLRAAEGNVSFYFANGDYSGSISNKYDLTILYGFVSSSSRRSIIGFDVSELSGCGYLRELYLSSFKCYNKLNIDSEVIENLNLSNNTDVTGNIKTLEKCHSLQRCNLNVTDFDGDIYYIRNLTSLVSISLPVKVSGDITNLSNMSSVTSLQIPNCSLITGNISSLGKMTGLRTLYISGTSISGSIEEFVAAQVQNGRTSVSMENPIASADIMSVLTFGGTTYTSGYNYLTWESSSKIIIYVSPAPNITYYNTVYAKGATAEEIAAWENAGKTVVVVE